MNSPQDPLVETRKIGSWSVVAGIALLLSIAVLVVLSRSGEHKLLADARQTWFGHPRAATVDEQREFLRLMLEHRLEPSTRSRPGRPASAPPEPARTPRIALNAVPSRLCNPMPQVRWCEPDPTGRTLMSESPSPETKIIERAPLALRRALVQAKPAADRFPDPDVPGVLVYNGAQTLSKDDERFAVALFRREIRGGLGHVFATWAVVSTDERTALMDVVATGGTDGDGYTAIFMFERDAQGWRLAEKLTH